MHHPDCDVNDRNIEGIRKPCNCGASPSAATAPEQVQTPGVGSVAAGSPERAFAELFEQARRSPHYWCEAIELCTTKKHRMSLAREIAEIVKAAQENKD
jgi:hypothetical protein